MVGQRVEDAELCRRHNAARQHERRERLDNRLWDLPSRQREPLQDVLRDDPYPHAAFSPET
jgi:hypothetical protein